MMLTFGLLDVGLLDVGLLDSGHWTLDSPCKNL